MDETPYDIVIIGAGSGGLTAARFAAQLGAKTALIERNRIGGDCTWTGCVPSKALLRAAKVANEVRNAARYGIDAGPVSIDMVQVRRFVRSAIEEVYQYEPPEVLEAAGNDHWKDLSDRNRCTPRHSPDTRLGGRRIRHVRKDFRNRSSTRRLGDHRRRPRRYRTGPGLSAVRLSGYIDRSQFPGTRRTGSPAGAPLGP